MYDRIIVIPSSNQVIINGNPLPVTCEGRSYNSKPIHAIQWYAFNGVIEFTDSTSIGFSSDEYEAVLGYYIAEYEREKERLKQEAAYNEEKALQAKLEAENDPVNIRKRLTDAIQLALDTFAQTRNYDGIMSCCSYYGSKNAKFAAEANYCLELRDETWAAAYAFLDEVLAGQRNIPTEEELVAALPVSSAQWPDEVEAGNDIPE